MILVTGLTGLVGSGFMTYLSKRPEICKNIVALCRDSSDVSHLEKYCIIERGSSWDEECLDSLCNKYHFEMLIHISNKGQIVQFSRLAAKHGIKRTIMVSSTYACSKIHPDNGQLKAEKECESILRDAGIEYIFLRPTSIFGTRPDGKKDRNLSIFTDYVRRWPLFPIFARGKATVRPMWGVDVGQALMLCYDHFDELKNKALICSGDQERSFKEMLRIIAKVQGKKIHFLYLPAWLGRFVFYFQYYLSGKKKDNREKIDRLLEDRSFDTSDELLALGYVAHPLEDSLRADKISY